MKLKDEIIRGLLKENPVFVLLLGMCPTLAISNSASNGFGMGIAVTAVLTGSNVVIAMIKNLIPDKVRIPAFVVVIACFVSIIDLSMEAYVPDLHAQLGIFIPLIVVNCLILGRAEAFAQKNGVFASTIDGIFMGLGFTLSLSILGSIRELLGAGTVFNLQVLPANSTTILMFILQPGAFLALGFLIALVKRLQKKKA